MLTIRKLIHCGTYRFADLRTDRTKISIRVVGYKLFAEQDDKEIERENDYEMVLKERALRNMAVPQQQSGRQERPHSWLTKMKLKKCKTSSWGGLTSASANVLSPI